MILRMAHLQSMAELDEIAGVQGRFRPLFLIFKKLTRAPAILCRLEDWFESITTHSYLKKMQSRTDTGGWFNQRLQILYR